MLNTYDTHGGLDGNENVQAEFAAADLAAVIPKPSSLLLSSLELSDTKVYEP